MSFIYRDATVVPRMRFNQATSVYQHFIKYWHTTTKINFNGDPVQVYTKTRTFYHGGRYINDTVSKKFIKSIGMNWEEFISGDVDSEIEKIYFKWKHGFSYSGLVVGDKYPDKSNLPKTEMVDPSSTEISESINNAFFEVDSFKTTIVYGGETDRYIDEHELGWEATGGEILSTPLDRAKIRSIVESNPWYYLANTRHLGYIIDNEPAFEYDGEFIKSATRGYHKSSDRKLTPFQVSTRKTLYGILAPLDSDAFTKVGSITDEEFSTSDNGLIAGQIARYSYTQEYKFNGVTESSQLVKDIKLWFDTRTENINDVSHEPLDVDEYREDASNSMTDTIYKRVFTRMMIDSELPVDSNGDLTGETVENSLWLKISTPVDYGPGIKDPNAPKFIYSSYPKVETIRNMKKAEFVKFLTQSLDTDYTVEKQKWWEKVLFVVIIIVAIVISYFTANPYSGWAFVAAFAGTLSFSLVIGGMIMSEIGGLSSGRYVKIIGVFAQVSGYVAIIAGIMAAYQGFAQEAAKREAAKQGAKNLAGEALKQATSEVTLKQVLSEIVTQAISSVKNLFTGATQLTVKNVTSSVTTALNMIQKVNDYMLDKEMEELRNDTEDFEQEQKEYEASLSSSVFKNGSILIGMEMSRISEYDAISVIDLQKFNDSASTFKTSESYNWSIGVNS